ncbi:cytochrome P450 [Immersiella caudata]|uniref:Cytochrome P450 n=1 Tax=Immersiella caudata TaxID=314043 RepID=A0AA39WD76_9PEZI|nr:cytochrome P450 [Immersiella caudata]
MSTLSKLHDGLPEPLKDRAVHLVAAFAAAYLLYWTAVIIYRLTFHPLAKYPGPLLCRIGWFYQTYFEAILGGRMLERLPMLHEKYGPVVRINPGEVHIKDPVVFHEIFKHNTKFVKDRVAYTLGVPNALSMLFDIAVHRRRRETLNPCFSKRRVLMLEDLMYNELEQLLDRAADYIDKGKPVPIQDAYYCYTADVISAYLFGKSMDLINQPNFGKQSVERLRSLTDNIWILVHFGFIHKFVSALPRFVATWLNETWQMAILVEAEENARSGGLWRNRKPIKMGVNEIRDESVGLLMAGTETTATMLAYATYYFLAFPEVQAKVLSELGTLKKNELGRLSIQHIESLPYFTGYVKETLRFAHGVPGRLTRVVPEGGLYVPAIDNYIPAGTVVGMSHIMIHNDPEIFENPTEFRPERWMGEKGKKLDHWLLAFSKGSRDCVGMNLAYTEMHLVLANLFTRLELTLVPGTHEDMVWKDRAIVRNKDNLRVLAKFKDRR